MLFVCFKASVSKENSLYANHIESWEFKWDAASVNTSVKNSYFVTHDPSMDDDDKISIDEKCNEM